MRVSVNRAVFFPLFVTANVFGCAQVLGLGDYKDGSAGGGGATTSSGTLGKTSAGGGDACSEGSTKTCYTGASATLAVGACKAGTATCIGGVYGACEGETTPAVELCAKKGDEDCNGSACSEPLWIATYPNANTGSVDFDASGALYVGGFFSGSAWGLA